MKKQYKIEVDCANCAAKIEAAIGKIEGVTSVSINYLLQKLILELHDTADERAILKEIKKKARKIESDFEIYC